MTRHPLEGSVDARGWQGVRSGNDRRRVVYWRYVKQGPGGSVSRKADGWRALGYGWSTPSDNCELGTFSTRRKAEVVVEEYSDARYRPGDICETCNMPARRCGHRQPESGRAHDDM